jgi:hypothetical protein
LVGAFEKVHPKEGDFNGRSIKIEGACAIVVWLLTRAMRSAREAKSRNRKPVKI